MSPERPTTLSKAGKPASEGGKRGAKKGAPADSGDYTAKNLAVLEGLDAVRKRPGMYIGSTDSRGLMHCLWEIIDNSVDEALAGHCHNVEVHLSSDGSVEVKDDGRGIPVDIEAKSGLTGVELVMTKLHAGGKFGGGSYAASGGLHGVGASVVNALSIRMDVAVARDGALHTISFQRGTPGAFDKPIPDAKFTPGTGNKNLKKDAKAGKISKKATGTTIKYWADPQIFLREADYDIEEIHARARQTAFLVPGLTITVHDNRTLVATSEKFHFTGGISEYCTFLQPDTPICDVIRLKGSGHYQETVPVLDSKGHLVPTDVERDLSQCLEETLVCKPISDERIQNMIEKKYFEILKRWEIKIQPLDRGCVVSFGYKNVGFEDIDIAMGTIREYFDKPAKVLTELGFDKDLL